MKKRSIAVRLGVAAMALTMITTSMSSGTLAKYTASVSGNSQVYVARWHVSGKVQNAAGENVLDTSTSTFSLHDLLSQSLYSDTKLNQKIGVIKGGTDTQVKLAPGTHGGFALMVDTKDTTGLSEDADTTDNVTDVAVDFKISMASVENELPKNLKFYLGKKKTNENEIEKNDPADKTGISVGLPSDEDKVVASGVIAVGDKKTAAPTPIYIYWEWPYEDEGKTAAYNSNDMDDGEKASEIDRNLGQLKVTLEMVQHNPGDPITTNSLTGDTNSTVYGAPAATPAG